MASKNSDKIIGVCQKKLEMDFRCTKHYNGWFFLRGKKVLRVTVQKGAKPCKIGTYKSIADQLFLSTKELDDLISCTLKKEDFEKLLTERLTPNN
jgi:hypothetical protein